MHAATKTIILICIVVNLFESLRQCTAYTFTGEQYKTKICTVFLRINICLIYERDIILFDPKVVSIQSQGSNYDFPANVNGNNQHAMQFKV